MDRLKNNLTLKIIALILAVMLWMVANLDEIMNRTTPADPGQVANQIDRQIKLVEVDVRYNSEDYVIASEVDKVDIFFHGDRSLLSGPIPYEVYVDLTNKKAGTHTVPVIIEGVPKGIKVESNPQFIKVTLEAKQIKEMQVKTNVAGTPAQGYSSEDPIVNPLKVQIKASESQLKKVSIVEAFINISGATETVKETVKLRALDSNGEPVDIEIEPAVVELTVPITHPFVKVPVNISTIGFPPEGFAIQNVKSNTDTITVYGTDDLLAGIDFYTIPVDVRNLRESTTLTVPVPKNEKPIEFSPESIEVSVEIVPSELLEVQDIPIQIRGVTDGYEASITNLETGTIDLIVEGAPKQLAGITRDDIQANVMVTDLSTGVHEVPVEIILPRYVKLAGDKPITVTVDIREKHSQP